MNDSDIFAGLMAVAGIFFFAITIGAAIYVLMSWPLSKIFKKAGIESWKAWVPFLNMWKFLELGGYNGALILLGLIPYVGSIAVSVISILAANEISKKLGKADSFFLYPLGLLTAGITTIIWYFQMANTENPWNDSLGKESLAKGTILGYKVVEEEPAGTPQEAIISEEKPKTEEAEVVKESTEKTE